MPEGAYLGPWTSAVAGGTAGWFMEWDVGRSKTGSSVPIGAPLGWRWGLRGLVSWCHFQKSGLGSAVNKVSCWRDGSTETLRSVPRADLNSGATLAAYKIYVLPFSFNSQFSFSQKIKRRKWLEETVENEKSFIFQNILFVLQKPANLHMVQLPCPRFIAIVRLCPWRGKSSRPFLHIMQVFGNFIPFQSFIRHLGGVVGLFSVFSIVIQIKKFWESALDYVLLLLSHVSRVRLCATP